MQLLVCPYDIYLILKKEKTQLKKQQGKLKGTAIHKQLLLSQLFLPKKTITYRIDMFLLTTLAIAAFSPNSLNSAKTLSPAPARWSNATERHAFNNEQNKSHVVEQSKPSLNHLPADRM
jgi:hypothetical protein